MDELNAFYNKMSVYGDTYGEGNFTLPYKDPFPKSIPIDPNAGQPPILEPLMPPMKYINQGGDNNGGIKALAGMDYGYDSVFDNTNITPIMPNGEEQPQTNFEYDIGEGTIPQEDIDNNKTNGIAALIDLYKKFSPMGMIYRAGKTGIETAQKYFADKKEDQRLFEIQEAEKIRNAEEAAFAAAGGNRAAQEAQRRADEATVAQANRDYSSGASYSGGESTPGDDTSYNDPFDPGGGEKDGGHIDGTNRRRYGKGGIVTL